MAYRKHPLAALIEVNRTEAVAQILAAYKEAGACQLDAARVLGVSESTLIRWVTQLALGAKLAKVKAQAKREGWHHDKGRQGGRRGKAA